MRLFLAFPLSLSLSLRRGITLRSNNKMCCVVNVLINTEHTKSIARFIIILFSHIFCGPPRERKIAATWRPRKETQKRTDQRKDDERKEKKDKKTNEFRDTTHTCHKKKRAAQRDTKEKHRQQRWGLLPRARTCHR